MSAPTSSLLESTGRRHEMTRDRSARKTVRSGHRLQSIQKSFVDKHGQARRLWEAWKWKHTLDDKEWISPNLKKRAVWSCVALNIVIIATITTLWILSKKKHGFVKTTDGSSKAFLKLSLCWTFVPNLLFQLHSLGYGVIVAACLFRQPFVELRRGAPAEHTIFLNYISLSPGKLLLHTLRNHHWTCLFSALMGFAFTLLVVPLSSRLFVELPHISNETVTLMQNTGFELSYQPLTTIKWDLAPVLGTTSAITSYGAKYPTWSNNHFAFQGFADPDKVYSHNAQPNITVVTWAYGVDLDCNSLNSSEYDASGPSGSAYGTMQLSAVDRGCRWNASITTSSLFSTYLKTQNNVDCPSHDESRGSGRLIVLAAQSPVTFDNMTVLSCIPMYTKCEAILTLKLTGVDDHEILNVQMNEGTKQISQPDWWNSFESQLSQVTIRDTTQTLGQADSTNYLGRLILDHTRIFHTDNALSADSLIESAATIYSIAYATLLVTQLTKPVDASNGSLTLNGVISTTVNRVSVVDFVAAVILAVFVIATGNLIQIWLYTRRHRSVLREELDHLVSYAGILSGSVISEDIEAVRKHTTFNGQNTQFVKRHLDQHGTNGHLYAMEQVNSLANSRIVRKPQMMPETV